MAPRAPRFLASNAALACVLLGCGQGSPEPVSFAEQAVTGAPDAADTSDAAVVLVGGVTDGGTGQTYWGSGTIVSPHVVLTAAHVVTAVAQAGPKYFVFAGSQTSAGASGDWLQVREVHVDPAFANGSLGTPHDLAVMILDAPTSVAPVPLQRSALDSSWIGKPIRFVGYGYLSGLIADESTGGTRRQGSSTISALSSGYIDTEPGGSQPCLGDSGGPGLLVVGGTELLAGVVQGGDSACTSAAFTRVDLNTDFIDQWIDAFDPPPDAGASARDAADDVAPPGDAGSDDSPSIGSEPSTALDNSLGATVGCGLAASPRAGGTGVWLVAAGLAAGGARRRRKASAIGLLEP